MIGELINGAYHVLGELRGSTRPGLWLAHSLVTGELVTLAVPAPGGDPPTADGLRREGEIFGEITNRHVQAVVDWSCDDVLVVWAYLPAWTLATALRAAPPPSVGAVMRLMLEVSQGLSAVHSRGAVYCGLHPGRILVQRDGTASLATTPEAVLAKRGRLVATGPPPETPVRYLAPEQIEGAAGGRSDLYSRAAVAYELLTGHKIYTNPDSVTLAVEISKTTPPPPSTYRPDLPPEVDDLFAYCLARKPQDRPGSVAALVPYLNKLLSSVAGPETESLAFRLGLHPVAYPLLASDTDRAALFSAVSVPTGGQPQQADAAMAEEAGAGEIARAADGSDGDGNGPAGRRELLDGRRHAGSAPRSFSSDPAFWPAYLVASDGRTYPLETADATVGRRGTNGVAPDIDLRDLDLGMVVSREHAALRFPRRCLARDRAKGPERYVAERSAADPGFRNAPESRGPAPSGQSGAGVPRRSASSAGRR